MALLSIAIVTMKIYLFQWVATGIERVFNDKTNEILSITILKRVNREDLSTPLQTVSFLRFVFYNLHHCVILLDCRTNICAIYESQRSLISLLISV